MIGLRELLSRCYPDRDFSSLSDIPVKGVECDSRKVERDFVFVAISGHKQNGAVFIEEALAKGAVALVVDQPLPGLSQRMIIQVPDTRYGLAKLASIFYGNPSSKMKVIGVTGTNGKTTCTYLLEHLLKKENKKTGVIGTISFRHGDVEVAATETTPGPVKIQQILQDMLQNDCEYAAMEVSSHALDQNRVAGVDFETALFTNLTQDHLDYHKTMDAYFESKARLFTGLRSGKKALINADDIWGNRLREKLKPGFLSYGIRNTCDLKAENSAWKDNKTVFELLIDGKQRIPVELPLAGLHNLYNALGSLLVMRVLGFDLAKSAKNLADFKGVPGRLELVDHGQNFLVFVDFAHTPDGLSNVLNSLTPYKKRKLIVVFGCGGDRDKTKRPQMGRIAASIADFVYITSDNPRSENPKKICEEIREGIPKEYSAFALVPDRAKAIRQALLSARKDDIVLLAGKGHERTQIIGKEAFAFSDQDEARKILSGN